LAVGKQHFSGKHKYSIRIDDATDVGIGIVSSKRREQLNTEASLHLSEGCCVYYYTGVWYGKTKGTSVTGRGETFRDGDVLDVYFNVKSRKVKIFKNKEKLLLRCRTLEKSGELGKQKKEPTTLASMGLAVVLGKEKSKVSILDYSNVKRFPKEKNRSDTYHIRATNVVHH